MENEKFPEGNAFKIKVKGEIQPVTFTKLTETTHNLGTELFELGYEDKVERYTIFGGSFNHYI